jgi:spore germination cell wall hydrolase CwlJ-like protein
MVPRQEGYVVIFLARILILLPLAIAAFICKSQPIPDRVVEIQVPPAVTTQAFTEAEIKCAADMVFGEAGSEPFDGMVAAAAVAIRRSLSSRWDFDLCKVVKEPGQFYGYSKRKKTDIRSERSVRFAIKHYGEYPEAYYFHRKEIKGNYAAQYTIGNHTFYRRN